MNLINYKMLLFRPFVTLFQLLVFVAVIKFKVSKYFS